MSSVNPYDLLEADLDFGAGSENDTSNYVSGLESDTTSLISSAKTHIFENGRRYHGYKEGKYVLPNDEAEQDRMDLLHHCCLLALHGDLFVSPVGSSWQPQRILDIGTGSGIWAIDIADQYPTAEVIGVDLSPIQPHWVPPNVTFEVDDVEEPWQYRESSFDLVHLRIMAGSLHDWPWLYRQAFRALKPGGWIEVQELCDMFSTDDGSLPPDSLLAAWANHWEKASAMCGREWNSVAPAIAKALVDVGCVDVGEKVFRFPIGRWPKGKHEEELGMYWRQQFLDGAEGITLALFTRVLGWNRKAVDDFLLGVRKDLQNPSYHCYSKFYCTYGRKPAER